jgi:ferrous iron transport protein A
MIPLSSIEQGQTVRIVKVEAGRGIQTRIRNLGILEGDTVQVILNARGPLIIAKQNLRLALGRGMSSKIFVEGETKTSA